MITPNSLLNRPRLISASVLLCACYLSNPALAAENNELAVPMGVWGLDSAILPLSGLYGQIIAPSYRADSVKDSSGKDFSFNKSIPGIAIPIHGRVNARIKVDALVPKLVYVSEDPVFGGRIGSYIAVPLLNKSRDVTISVTTPLPLALQQKISSEASHAASGEKRGIGDVEVAGFIGWKFESLSLVAAMNVDLPTGSFDRNSQVNLGLNSYSIRPLVSAAWSTESGFDVAASISYNYSTANRETNYKSGQYIHAEYVGSYQFSNNFKGGIQGYYLQQTSDDKDPGNTTALTLVGGNRARVSALGPIFSYQTDDLKTQIDLKYLKEFSARARPEGGLALVTLSRLF
ncbi:MAG: transporter [Undibacterium sp.]|nr:transporter [Undibacterium sp.]